MKKLSKSAVNYSRGMGTTKCGSCRHFHRNGSCSLVAGPIDPAMWCIKFAKKQEKAHAA